VRIGIIVMRFSASRRRLTLMIGALADDVSAGGYAFGGGGSGDSTREWNSVATYTGALNRANPALRVSSPD